jgi:hypothetical protein
MEEARASPSLRTVNESRRRIMYRSSSPVATAAKAREPAVPTGRYGGEHFYAAPVWTLLVETAAGVSTRISIFSVNYQFDKNTTNALMDVGLDAIGAVRRWRGGG